MDIRLNSITLLFILFSHSCQKDSSLTDYSVNDPTETADTINSLATATTQEGTPCLDGFAGKYPCGGYDLLAHINLTTFDSDDGNDSWGWTDPSTEKEYVLMGLDNGTAFVDISDPENPILLGKLPTATESSPWRDIKVHNNYAYVVSEATDHGIQVFDLTRLRGVEATQSFNADHILKTVPTAHNIVINPDSGYAFVVGTSRYDVFKGGVHFLDLNNPEIYRFVGGYGEGGYTHDAQVINYNGPDTDYTGKEIFLGSNESKLVIVDVTDKQNPTAISDISYQNPMYTHQGWFDKDQRFFILGDELDESRIGGKTRTLIFDLNDLDNPVLHHSYFGPTNAIDHNGYVKGDLFYLANYTAGIRVIDINDLENKNMSEIGFFDTFPDHNSTTYDGAWNVYPYFKSGVIAISDINSGLFLIKKSE